MTLRRVAIPCIIPYSKPHADPTGLDLLPPDVVGVMSAVASAYPWSYNVTPLTMHKTANTGTVTQLSLQMTLALALLGMEAAAAAAGLSCPAPGSGV